MIIEQPEDVPAAATRMLGEPGARRAGRGRAEVELTD